VLDVLRHVEDERPFLRFQLAEGFAEAVVDIVGVLDRHRRPGRKQRHGVLVEHALRIVGIAQRSVPAEHQYRRSMQPSVNERVGRVGVPGSLRGGAKPDLAGEARITVRHADGGSLMMGMNVCETVLFAQLHNDVLVGVAHDRENVIDVLSCNRGRKRFKHLHSGLHSTGARCPTANFQICPAGNATAASRPAYIMCSY
jgi:hypothetical protein